MNRWMSVVVAVCAATGCSDTTEPMRDASPPETVVQAPTHSTFAGTWRSTTPSTEFVRLTVQSKSSEQGALAALLTFSGVAWEGSGRIEGNSFVANMAMIHTASPVGVLVANARDAQTLRVQLRPATGAALDLTFVREN